MLFCSFFCLRKKQHDQVCSNDICLDFWDDRVRKQLTLRKTTWLQNKNSVWLLSTLMSIKAMKTKQGSNNRHDKKIIMISVVFATLRNFWVIVMLSQNMLEFVIFFRFCFSFCEDDFESPPNLNYRFQVFADWRMWTFVFNSKPCANLQTGTIIFCVMGVRWGTFPP